MVWETAGGKWDVIVVKDELHVRLTCYETEKIAVETITDLGWNLLSVVRIG